MSDELLGTILSAVIAGVFTLIGKRMELGHTRGGTEPSVPPRSDSPSSDKTRQPALGAINYGLVVRYIGIIQFVASLATLISDRVMPQFLAESFVTVIYIVGYFWLTLRVDRDSVWTHLTLAAVGVSITTVLINGILSPAALTLTALIISLLYNFLLMGASVLLSKWSLKERP
jgi:hypothetical protein